MKILIVDDMPTMRKLIQMQFQRLGYSDTVVAGNGNAAWRLVESSPEPFDLIVSDWNMPIATGLELLMKVRGDERFKNTPFVLLTSEGEPQTKADAEEAGVTEFLMKPFDADSLVQRLEKHFKKSA